MWLLTTFASALFFTGLYFLLGRKYKLEILSLMLWGGTIMILVDHLMGYKGGQFLERKTEGLIPDAVLLGLFMLLPVVLLWLVIFLVSLRKGGRS
jgi:O-antigen/teichoic acid export membrane protein